MARPTAIFMFAICLTVLQHSFVSCGPESKSKKSKSWKVVQLNEENYGVLLNTSYDVFDIKVMLEDLGNTVATLVGKTSGISNKVSEIESALEEQGTTVTTLVENTSGISNKVSEIESALEEQGTTVTTLVENTSGISNKVSEIESALEEQGTTVTTLVENTSGISNKVSEIESALEEQGTTVTTLVENTSGISNKVSEIESALEEQGTTVTALVENTSNISNRVSEMENVLEEQRTAVTTLVENTSNISNRVSEMENVLEGQATAVTTLVENTSNISTRVSEMEKVLGEQGTAVTTPVEDTSIAECALYASGRCAEEEDLVSEINDEAITASSVYSQSQAACGRYDAQCSWQPNTNDDDQFLQFEFENVKLVTGIKMRNRNQAEYTSNYGVAWSIDCGLFPYYNQNMKTYDDSATNITFVAPILAKCVRVNAIEWSGTIKMNIAIMGC